MSITSPLQKWKAANACIRVACHPWLQHTCVAVRDIPRHTRLYYWGTKIPYISEVSNDDEYTLSVCDRSANIDPRPFVDAILQFSNSPGPDECDNIRPTACVESDGAHLIAQEFITTRNIPTDTQLLWGYGSDLWFSERNIPRRNASAPNLPAPRPRPMKRARKWAISVPTDAAPSTCTPRGYRTRARATRASSSR